MCHIFLKFSIEVLHDTILVADHSHFERVIEHLKQIEAEELQYADKDESIDLTGEEEMEGNQEICV